MDDAGLVTGLDVADELDLGLVLVRPEVGDRVEGQGGVGAGEQGAGGGHALLGGVGPVLEAHLGVEERVGPAGHVAGGDDAGRGPASGVADHAVAQLESRGRQPVRTQGAAGRQALRMHQHEVNRLASWAPEDRALHFAASLPLTRDSLLSTARQVKDSPKRLDTAKKALVEMGGEFKAVYMTMGDYDLVAVYEAPDDAVAARFTLLLGQMGAVRTRTLKAFPEAAYREIIHSLG